MPISGKLVVAVLAVPESTAGTLYGMYEVLESAGRDWSAVTQGVLGESRIRPMNVSADGRPFRASNGLVIEPTCTLEQCAAPDVVAIPDLSITPAETITGRHPEELAWLERLDARGVTFATACTGAYLLAEAGLLDGLDVTTHWAYCDAMAARYPRLHMHPNRALVVSGGGRFIMAGGGSSWNDLALYLIARFVGAEEAMRVARLHLLEWHHVGQQPFAALTACRRTD